MKVKPPLRGDPRGGGRAHDALERRRRRRRGAMKEECDDDSVMAERVLAALREWLEKHSHTLAY